MTSPVPTPVASGSRTDIVTVMCASPFVTLTDVVDTANEVRVGRMSSACAGLAPARSAAAATRPAAAGSPIHRPADVGVSVAKLGMLYLSLAALRCVVPSVAQHDHRVWNGAEIR